MAKAPAHAFASTLKTFKTASGKAGKYWSLHGTRQAISRTSTSCRSRSASCWSRCCATATARRSRAEHVEQLANWAPNAERTDEIPFVVTRMVLQDFTGVPLLADLAAMRSVAQTLGKSPKTIEPLVPVDLVVDHSVQVDYYGTPEGARPQHEAGVPAQQRALPVHEVGHAGLRHLRRRAAGHRHRAPGEPRVPRARRLQEPARQGDVPSTTPTRWSAPTATPP